MYEVESSISVNSSILWYASKGNDTVTQIKTTNLFVWSKSKETRKNILADMLADNKNIYDKYMYDDKFSFKQIRYLILLYNNEIYIPDTPEKQKKASED